MKEWSIEDKRGALFWAFRYALGRQTYAVSDVAAILTRHWNDLDTDGQRKIKAEILDAIHSGAAGHSCDEEVWKKILNIPVSEAA